MCNQISLYNPITANLIHVFYIFLDKPNMPTVSNTNRHLNMPAAILLLTPAATPLLIPPLTVIITLHIGLR